jgi:hypothetical protein
MTVKSDHIIEIDETKYDERILKLIEDGDEELFDGNYMVNGAKKTI